MFKSEAEVNGIDPQLQHIVTLCTTSKAFSSSKFQLTPRCKCGSWPSSGNIGHRFPRGRLLPERKVDSCTSSR